MTHAYNRILRRLEGLSTAELVAGTVAVVLGVDWALSPKGKSLVSKGWEKVASAAHLEGHAPHHALPPPPPPPPGLHPSAVPAPHVASGYYAGANDMAGWNRGTMPYGGWAHASPGGPWPYAHAASYAWE